MTRSTLLLIFTILAALVLAACNPFGLRDSDDERIQLVADMTDAAENEDWEEVRSYLVPDARDLSDRATRAAVFLSVMTTTYSPIEWFIDDYEEWSLVRYPEDALSGTVVREVDGDWLIDPGLSRLTRGRLVQEVSHEYLYHEFDALPYSVDGLGSADELRTMSISVESVVVGGDGLHVALILRIEQSGLATIGLDDIHWHTLSSSGPALLRWSSAPLTGDQSAVELRLPESSGRMHYWLDLFLPDAQLPDEEVTVTLDPLHWEDTGGTHEDETAFEVSVSFNPETNPDFSDPDSIPTPIQAQFEVMPFDVLQPMYIPFEYESPSFQEHDGCAVAEYRAPPLPYFVEFAQCEAGDDLSVHDGESVEINGVSMAQYVDDGEVSQLTWIDEASGVEIVITSREGDKRQPLEELIRIAEGME